MTNRTNLSQLAHDAGFDLFDYDGCRDLRTGVVSL